MRPTVYDTLIFKRKRLGLLTVVDRKRGAAAPFFSAPSRLFIYYSIDQIMAEEAIKHARRVDAERMVVENEIASLLPSLGAAGMTGPLVDG